MPAAQISTIDSADTTPQKASPLPIGVFIDLDNVAPKTHSREDAKKFIYPLLQLGLLINMKRSLSPSFKSDPNTMKQIQRDTATQFEAFGNLATRSYRSAEQKEVTTYDQEYIPWIPDDELELGGYAQTGYDALAETLRCGICGWKAKLTKKKRAKYKNRGWTDENDMLENELMEHIMKSLHDREQQKRVARVQAKKGKNGRRVKGMKGKELVRFNKYKAAQVGLQSGMMAVDKHTGQVKVKSRNDLFQVLREIGVSTKSSDDVDTDLISAAEKWVRRTLSEYKDNTKMIDRDRDEEHECPREESSPVGVLVIYSKDCDFIPLIESAKRRRYNCFDD